MTEPVKGSTRSPRQPDLDAVNHTGVRVSHVRRDADEDRRETHEAVEDGDKLRHAGHHDPRGHDRTDDATDDHGAYEQCVELNTCREEGPAHRDDHADDAEDVSAACRLLVGQPAQGHDEEDTCNQVGDGQLILCE